MGDSLQQAAGSNISFAVAIVALVLFVFGTVLGEHLAESFGYKLVTRRDYVLANIAWFVGGIALSSIVWATGWTTLAAFSFGMIAGGMAGFKIAFGESVGPWKFVDKFFNTNKRHVAAANDAHADARREARRKWKEGKGPEPELMSVQQPSNTQQSSYKKQSAGSNAKKAKKG
ncbi:hypothetical protein [Atopobium fossor]|uniref:hypothetical protein n=1 Tax=Atopobium fossor TaxID=39487 RepID=UPI00041598D7|nr:hypothetical protein [Atopobium fossor]